jgi:hypothetical protein
VEAKRQELEDYFQLGMRMEDAWNRSASHTAPPHTRAADDVVAGGRPSARRIRRLWPTSGTRAFASEACAPYAPTP